MCARWRRLATYRSAVKLERIWLLPSTNHTPRIYSVEDAWSRESGPGIRTRLVAESSESRGRAPRRRQASTKDLECSIQHVPRLFAFALYIHGPQPSLRISTSEVPGTRSTCTFPAKHDQETNHKLNSGLRSGLTRSYYTTFGLANAYGTGTMEIERREKSTNDEEGNGSEFE